ncbi:MAG TPA: clostripain-related cysteine peptidase [Candidatus Rifleibacterium sp.]|nr:clostripain-related cysteine peptidase [Candidatus Rifleibacterium sp.]HPT47770.1 clostripain-related cysteine peptidase [Candidatus Rifleibacterium sp.]
MSNLKKFSLAVLLLAWLFIGGCSGESGPTLIYNYPVPTSLVLSGIINLEDVTVHGDLGGITPSLLDMRPFSVSIQDNPAPPVSADEQGNFTLEPISIRDQVVILCQHKTQKNLVLEWMAATSAGLYGSVKVTVDIRSTARSMIARCLREKYGRRIKPEELKPEHIDLTVRAIAEVLEKFPGKIAAQPLDQVPEIKSAYTAMADSLHLGNSGAYPNEHVLLLHMAGDNSLSSFVSANIEEIAEAGLPSATQILIQVDTPVEGLRRLMISGNKVVELAALGAFDSSSGAVIADFIAWSRRAFPAKRYSLVISSHADGWKSASGLRQSLIVDNSADKKGNPIEIAAGIQAAASLFSGTSRPLDLLVFDACNMAYLEIALQFKNCAAFTLFSQAFVPAAGLPYKKIVAAIKATGAGNLDGESLGKLICSEYRRRYLAGIVSEPVTISLIRNASLTSFMTRLNTWFAKISAEREKYSPVLAGLRDHLEFVLEEGEKKYVVQAFEKAENRDLKSLVTHATGPLTTLKIESENLLKEFPGLILVEYHSQQHFPGASGLSITFPDRAVWLSEFIGPSPSTWFAFALARETLWSDLLSAINSVE